MRRALLYGLLGGVLIAALKLLEYKHFVRAYPGEIYGGLIAILFTAVGVHFGLRWRQSREVVSSRLFDKLGVSRRVQAVERGRQLGLIP